MLFRKKTDPSKWQGPLVFVAVAYDGKTPLPVFDSADHFFAYYISGGKVKKKELLSLTVTEGSGLISQFRNSMFDAIIARDFGPRARAKLKAEGIDLYTWDGGTEAAIRAFLEKKCPKL